MKAQRILAVVGLVLMAISLVCMIGGMFAGAAKGLVTLISLVCFLGAVGILLALSAKRKQAAEQASEEKSE